MTPSAAPASLHRALADTRRVRIVDELRESPAGLDAHELAGRLELHPNTVRWHLAILADAGLIASRPGPHTKRGRPRTVYTLGEGAEAPERENYRLLATILAGTLIRMHRCPFRQLAETHPGIVCAVHQGLISGALAELGNELKVERLDAFVEPELCIARLRRTSV